MVTNVLQSHLYSVMHFQLHLESLLVLQHRISRLKEKRDIDKRHSSTKLERAVLSAVKTVSVKKI